MNQNRSIFSSIIIVFTTAALVIGALMMSIMEGSSKFIPVQYPSPNPVKPQFYGLTPTIIKTTLTPIIPTLPAAPTTCPPPVGWNAYNIMAGDSLESLAHNYTISPEIIKTNNCLVSDKLMPGTVIYLPFVPQTNEPGTIPTEIQMQYKFIPYITCGPPWGWVNYKVRWDDTLYGLSLKYGVSIYQLQSANCLDDSNLIYAGQMIYVPYIRPTYTPTFTITPTKTNTSTVTPISPPGTFGKSTPAQMASDISTTAPVNWENSPGALSYEYCIDTTNNNSCDGSWINAGTNTSVNPAGMTKGSVYSWQVRALNAGGTTYANSGTWWTFTTRVPSPSEFGKASPANGEPNIASSTTITWNSSSGATSYEYCLDTTNNNTCDGSWTDVGNNPSATLNNLDSDITFYWQVRAVNSGGTTEADGNTWWSFTTQASPPGAFNKNSPADSAGNIPDSTTITWNSSPGATSYEFCVDTTGNNNCDVAWTNVGNNTSEILNNLNGAATYYWQVHAINGAGTTKADGNTWWSFTTQVVPPAAFGKTNPPDGARNVSTTPTLSWEASLGTSSYEYCVSTSNATCDTSWVSTGNINTATPNNLVVGNTYYWQVHAINGGGTTDADGSSWWIFNP